MFEKEKVKMSWISAKILQYSMRKAGLNNIRLDMVRG
ncbi:hypothetical protein LCGC14_2434370, partial [marine sediment metagenome]